MLRRTGMKDKFLVLRCKAGSSDALRRIYEKYRDDLLILAIALLNDKAAAEDVLHDVFVSFVGHLNTFKFNGKLKAYLATCVANRARNVNRAKRTQTVDLDNTELLGSGSNETYQSIVCNEQLQQLSDALAQLAYQQCEVIMLHHQAGLSFNAIAKQQDISVNTVKSRYRYGIDKLRTIFRKAEL